jgi:hypothetical protein
LPSKDALAARFKVDITLLAYLAAFRHRFQAAIQHLSSWYF